MQKSTRNAVVGLACLVSGAYTGFLSGTCGVSSLSTINNSAYFDDAKVMQSIAQITDQEEITKRDIRGLIRVIVDLELSLYKKGMSRGYTEELREIKTELRDEIPFYTSSNHVEKNTMRIRLEMIGTRIESASSTRSN